jgi:hypothetical protein
MKQSKLNPRYVTAVAIASFAALVSACGSSGNGSGVGIPGVGIGIGVGNQCTPLSQQMSFSGYAAYIDSNNLYAGTVPNSPYGTSQIGLTSGGAQSGNQWINNMLPPFDGGGPRPVSDLTYLGLNITSTGGYVGGVYPTTGVGTTQSQSMIQGSFVFAQDDWQFLMTQFQGSTGYGGYPGYPTTGLTTLQNVTACSFGIETGLVPWNTGQGTLYSGYIFMTINGQEVSFKI